ncbi:MAG: SDR family oxidoreductase [Candidatus Competibacteraceae bacterium]|jgi:NAD(P)-dependent dehydrogenase (short-subunit alcohol dehydrogenase family)|nr:SDR family oxidoreductase [Candidatus Competibacteraceae bacterium]
MKTILITGTTDGIGLETARQLGAQGHRLLLHGRTFEKTQRTIEELRAQQTDLSAEPVFGDLSDMRQVLQLAEQVKEKAPVLDVLLNNAGVFENERRITPDGLELTMAINHFAPFLLTHALLDRVKAAAQGRVISVSSIAHQGGQLDLEDLTFKRSFSGYDAYCTSKLANILFTVALAQRLKGSAVTANCLHPGVISTKLLHSGFGIGGASVAEGARTSVYLATAEEIGTVTGEYFIDSHPATPSATARDTSLAEAFWQTSVELLHPFLSAND